MGLMLTQKQKPDCMLFFLKSNIHIGDSLRKKMVCGIIWDVLMQRNVLDLNSLMVFSSIRRVKC